jgi:hypothetical protein
MARPSTRPDRRRPKSAFYDHYAALPADTDFRANPHLYRVGRGEQGVLMVEPYKSELLPLWRFATPAAARRSASALHRRFRAYAAAGDFVGMDMARKFVQMGYTRARRYVNYKAGRKYTPTGTTRPRQDDPEKAESAQIFQAKWKQIREDPNYVELKRRHQRQYG